MGTHPIFESDLDCLTDRFGFLNNEASAPFARSYCGRWRLRRCQGACRHREGTTRRTRQELQALEGRNEIYWSPFHSCGKVWVLLRIRPPSAPSARTFPTCQRVLRSDPATSSVLPTRISPSTAPWCRVALCSKCATFWVRSFCERFPWPRVSPSKSRRRKRTSCTSMATI